MLYGKTADEVKQLILSGKSTICVVGAGKMGLPLATMFAQKGCKVIAVRPDKPAVDMINKGESPILEEPGLPSLLKQSVEQGNLIAMSDTTKAVRMSDAIIILVPLLIDENQKPDYTNVKDAAQKIGQGLKPNSLVVDETTMPPGATEQIILPLLEAKGLKAGKDFGLAHSPERLATGVVQRNLKIYPKIIGGIDKLSTEAAHGLYQLIVERIIPVSNIRTAELVKLSEGVYRDLNIAYANLLAQFAQRYGVDVWEVINAANEGTEAYCHIHRPSAGVGGHCIPVYPWFLIEAGSKLNLDMDLLKKARKLNDSMYLEVSSMIQKILETKDIRSTDTSIGILGVAFRPNVKEIRFAPSIKLVNHLQKELKLNVIVHDPYFSHKELIDLGFTPGSVETIMKSDVIILLTAHRQYEVLNDFFSNNLVKVIDATDRLTLPNAQWKIGRPFP